jgi:PAS domain S-box-containing protein
MVAARGAKEAVEVRGNNQIKSKIAKPKARHAEEKFRLMFEAATSAMIMVSDRGLITLVNPRTEQLFRYRWKELLEQRIEMLVPERYRSAHPDHRQDCFQHPTTGTIGAGRDLYGLRKYGGEVPMEIGLSSIETDEGSFVLASIIDITERKQAEQAWLKR